MRGDGGYDLEMRQGTETFWIDAKRWPRGKKVGVGDETRVVSRAINSAVPRCW